MVGVFCLWLAFFFFVNLHVCVNYTHIKICVFLFVVGVFCLLIYMNAWTTHIMTVVFVCGWRLFVCVLLLLSDCLWNVYIACVVYCMCWLVAVYLGISKSLRDSRPIADVCLMRVGCVDFLLMYIYMYIYIHINLNTYIYIYIYLFCFSKGPPVHYSFRLC